MYLYSIVIASQGRYSDSYCNIFMVNARIQRDWVTLWRNSCHTFPNGVVVEKRLKLVQIYYVYTATPVGSMTIFLHIF